MLNQTSLSRSDRRGPLRIILQWLLIVVPLWLLGRNLVANWKAVNEYQWRLDPLMAWLAMVSLLLVFGMSPFISRRVLAALGHQLTYRQMYQAYFMARIARYLPGGVYLSRSVALRPYGVSVVAASVGVLIELWILNVSCMMMAVPYLIIVGTDAIPQLTTIGPILFVLSVVGLHPRIFNGVMRWLMKRTGHKDVHINVSARQIIALVLISCAYLLAAGACFNLLLISVGASPNTHWLVLASGYALSWAATLTLCYTPGCLGVREGALALMLAPLIPAPLPGVISLLARIWQTVGELISLAIGSAWQRGRAHVIKTLGPGNLKLPDDPVEYS